MSPVKFSPHPVQYLEPEKSSIVLVRPNVPGHRSINPTWVHPIVHPNIPSQTHIIPNLSRILDVIFDGGETFGFQVWANGIDGGDVFFPFINTQTVNSGTF